MVIEPDFCHAHVLEMMDLLNLLKLAEPIE